MENTTVDCMQNFQIIKYQLMTFVQNKLKNKKIQYQKTKNIYD